MNRMHQIMIFLGILMSFSAVAIEKTALNKHLPLLERLTCVDEIEDLGDHKIVRGKVSYSAPELSAIASGYEGKSPLFFSLTSCEKTMKQIRKTGTPPTSGGETVVISVNQSKTRETYWNGSQDNTVCKVLETESILFHFTRFEIKSSGQKQPLRFGISTSKTISETPGDCE